jgi:hypothetical protein
MKRMLITAVAVFATGYLFAFLVHGVLLAEDYKAVSNLLRPDAEMKMGIMSLGYAIWSLGVAWLYSKGVEAKDWIGQGLRFGLALACVWAVPAYLGDYATMPFPLPLILKGLAGDTVNALACGLVAAAINRTPSKA